MSKRCELQKEYFKDFGNYKGNGKYSDDYVKWLEDKALKQGQILPIHNVDLVTNRYMTIDKAAMYIDGIPTDQAIQEIKAFIAQQPSSTVIKGDLIVVMVNAL